MKFRPSQQHLRKEQGTRALSSNSAFTLLELLVVIAIIGILATIGLPAIRGMTKSNSMVAADRQLLDDISFARRLAIANHTTIYIVFVPPNSPLVSQFAKAFDTTLYPAPLLPMLTNLWGGQYTAYALFSFRSVGDQPGQRSPRYWSDWRSLPNGIYIATNKFVPQNPPTTPALAPVFFSDVTFPFPTATNTAPSVNLPYIAFNYLGQLIHSSSETPVIQQTGKGSSQIYEYIQLAHGSIFYQRDANGALQPTPPDIIETPAGNAYYTSYTNCASGLPFTNGADAGKDYNQIYIDPLTGKARVQRQEVQ
jgi:prepilin-type N-terminal cleavage/methylation domain-containing protein